MKDIVAGIRNLIEQSIEPLLNLNPNEAIAKKPSDSWSKQEILGHLIDSAANNHQRFVRGACNAAADYPPYRQNDWVRVQQYNRSSWKSLVELWLAYNRHLSDLVERIPGDALSNPCNIGKAEPVALDFIIKDYLRHLRHHVEKILEPSL